MKRNTYFIVTLAVLFIFSLNTQAQTVNFSFANAQNTNDGSDDYYEVDVQISTDTDFKLGSGLLYFNYNTAAFGTNVFASGNITITYDNGTYILGEHEKDFNFGDLYNSYVTNDNTTSRVAFSWQQNYSSEVYSGNNVTSTATNLFHIKIKYADVNEDPSFCFESGSAFDDQTYTACGSAGTSALTTADCTTYPGTQLESDNFDCAEASLPVELLYFTAEPYYEDALITWETATEINNSHFEVQHSTNGVDFTVIGEVDGAGTTTENQYYEFIDQKAVVGENYYRLRQIDFDGNFEYTHMQVVIFEADDANVNTATPQITVYPNPTVNTLNIKTNQIGTDYIQIYNPLGQMVMQESTSSTDYEHRINVAELPSGSYMVKLEGINEMIKFIKD